MATLNKNIAIKYNKCMEERKAYLKGGWKVQDGIAFGFVKKEGAWKEIGKAGFLLWLEDEKGRPFYELGNRIKGWTVCLGKKRKKV